MRTQITVFLLILSFASLGQQLVLDFLNWNSRDYKFYFVEKRGIEEEIEPLEPTEPRIPKHQFKFQVDSTNSFLITDQKQIQNLKCNWKGVPTDEMLLCWYDYFVYVVHDNTIKHELRVNLECGQVVTGFGIFDFEGNPFEELENRIPIWVMSSKHEQLDEARDFVNTLNRNIILTDFENWIKYDGYFSVDRKYQGTGSFNDFEQLVLQTYPDKQFELQLSGTGPRTFSYNIYCNSTFYKLFDLDEKGNWHELTPNWITYFSEDSELLDQLLK